MTLIAQLDINGVPNLLSDVLVSSRAQRDMELVLPTRAKPSPRLLQGMDYFPAQFSRKLIDLGGGAYASGAGQYDAVVEVARAARHLLSTNMLSPDLIYQLIRDNAAAAQNVAMLLSGPYEGQILNAKIGHVTFGKSEGFGPYVVGGSGSEPFKKVMDMRSPERLGVRSDPRVHALQIAGHFLAREYFVGDNLGYYFGAAFEIACLTQDGFRCVDNVMHLFVTVEKLDGRIVVRESPHIIRQWYQDDWLFLTTAASVSEGRQGVLFHPIPSIFSGEMPEVDHFVPSTMPTWLCIYYYFPAFGTDRLFTMVMCGDNLVNTLEMHTEGANIHLAFKPMYRQFTGSLVEFAQQSYGSL